MGHPTELFCMRCGPDTAVQPGPHADQLRCPRCGIVQQLPGVPLFVVTGASGTGKSTVAEPLRARLPDCMIFETDVILDVAALSWDTWRNTWLQLAHAIALNGRATVLCGSILPEQVEGLPARPLVGPIHFCNLDCPDAVLADRLRNRPAWRGSSKEPAITEHQRFAAWLRTHIEPTFDTSSQPPAQVADHIASWIRPLLAPSSA